MVGRTSWEGVQIALALVQSRFGFLKLSICQVLAFVKNYLRSPWLLWTCCTKLQAVSNGFWQKEQEYSFGSANTMVGALKYYSGKSWSSSSGSEKGNNPPGQEWKVILRVVSGGINDTRKRSESRRSWEKVKKGKYFTPTTTDKDYCLYLEFVSTDVNGR